MNYESTSTRIGIGRLHKVSSDTYQVRYFAIHKDYRRRGIFRVLWDTRWEFVKKEFKGFKAYAWAKPPSLPLLIKKGFNKGDTCVYVEKNI